MTHLLVVSDVQRSRDRYLDVLDASLYGGTSVVLDLLGTCLLLVTGAPPTPTRQADRGPRHPARPGSGERAPDPPLR